MAKKAKEVQALTEFIDEYPDVYNVGEWIKTHAEAENFTRVLKIFDRYGIDLTKEREGYDFYALGVVYEAKQSAEARLGTSRKDLETRKTLYTLLIEKLKALAEDPYFCKYLGLNLDEIKNRLAANERALAPLDGKRAGPFKSVKYWLRKILPFVKSQGLGETTRVNLIRDLFIEFEVPGFGTDLRNRGYLEEKDQIRDWDREIMQATKSNSPQ